MGYFDGRLPSIFSIKTGMDEKVGPVSVVAPGIDRRYQGLICFENVV